MFAVSGVLTLNSLGRVSGFGLSRCGNTLVFKGAAKDPAKQDGPITALYVTHRYAKVPPLLRRVFNCAFFIDKK